MPSIATDIDIASVLELFKLLIVASSNFLLQVLAFAIELFKLPTVAALFGFLSGLISQLILRGQISRHEIRKEKIMYKKMELENLKQYAEKSIVQMNAFNELANYIVRTLKNGLYDEDEMSALTEKIKKINDELSPKLQIHFYELGDSYNEYYEAVRSLKTSFFTGLKSNGLKRVGWEKEDIERMNQELKELQKQKFQLIGEIIKYLQNKEDSLYEG